MLCISLLVKVSRRNAAIHPTANQHNLVSKKTVRNQSGLTIIKMSHKNFR